ncbi:MAG: hypothetical protein DDT21_02068 [Syntrophomonadaceae bacterium]|nr:hypothetical protein [Bacillota bacterium]
MGKEVIGFCPVCHGKLIATQLTCHKCDLNLTGDLLLNPYAYLTKEEQDFVALFLVSEGSFKDVQAKLNISYQRAKQMLSEILVKLQLKSDSDREISYPTEITQDIKVNESDHFVVKLIKEKLIAAGGVAVIPLISAGKEARIWFAQDGSGLECDKIPVPNQLTWEAFVAAYDIVVAQDGELYKGYARAGKLGSDKLPVASLEGYIAHAIHGVQIGGSAFSPGFIFAAVLDWVGILVNERGSTLKIVPETVCVSSYEEALKNAKTFLKEIKDYTTVMDRLATFRHWYYFDEVDGFAPSKFIGYKEMNMSAYQLGYRDGMDGRVTEQALKNHFRIAEGERKESLLRKLEIFLGRFNKKPNSMATIHIR